MTSNLKMIVPFVGVMALAACGGGGGGGGELARSVVAGPSSCAGVPGITSQFMYNDQGLPMRCGPQSALPYTVR